MLPIADIKEQSQTGAPVLLFECRFASGHTEYWSTHEVRWGDCIYEPRILSHSLLDFQLAGYEGVDTVSRIALTLANLDSYCSQLEQVHGFKGARLTAQFVFCDSRHGDVSSESRIVFRGTANPPEEIRAAFCKVSFTSGLAIQRLHLPTERIQRRCLWRFPSTPEERMEAVHGGERGRYSPFYPCGYSADVAEGVGNLDGGQPFTSCNYTREDCKARGMFQQDDRGRDTRRFSGCDFVPATILVRAHGGKEQSASNVIDNAGRYGDPIPLIYGTAWLPPLIVHSRNDGNLTHLEAVLSAGEIDGIVKLLVNDIEIPVAEPGKDMTATGWYQQFTTGNRTGDFNLGFVDSAGQPLGDPYGSVAAVSIVVPNRISDGRSVPRVKALVRGLKLNQYDEAGTYLQTEYSANPAWILLDLLQRAGWSRSQINLSSFARTAALLGVSTVTTDPVGESVIVPKFECNLVLNRRRSASEVIRGVRLGAMVMLFCGPDGRLTLRPESTFAEQHPTRDPGSNALEPFNGGWPAYEFSDGSTGPSNILCKPNGEASFRIFSRNLADAPNHLSVEYQDSLNGYQQDSYTLVDFDDISRTGQEVSVRLPALGIPHFHQAARVLYANLKRTLAGNQFVEFQTSVRGVELTPGDLITVTYTKDGLLRRPYRIVKLSPSTNFQTITIVAQLHDDAWYLQADQASGQLTAHRPQGDELSLPRPLAGPLLDSYGVTSLRIEEHFTKNADGGLTASMHAYFVPPGGHYSPLPPPVVSLSPVIHPSGGSLPGGQTFYYGVTAVDEDGQESQLSFLLRARLPAGSAGCSVTVRGIRPPSRAAGCHIYRGANPLQLLRAGSLPAGESSFTDSGNDLLPATPPDANFHHANLYWRLELLSETPVTASSPTTIGNSALHLPPNRHDGNVVRIVRGTGAGQERLIQSHDADSLVIDPPWTILPDQSSSFVIAEGSWRFGAEGSVSPVQFDVPGRVGATVHVSARSANVYDRESDPRLAPFARWRIGESAGLDWGIPPAPLFALAPTGRGVVEVGGFGFATLENTRSISSATITLHYNNLLDDTPASHLQQALSADFEDETLHFTTPLIVSASRVLQIGSEILTVTSWHEAGRTVAVRRAAFGTLPLAHPAGAPVFQLLERLFIIPFRKDFFGSPESGEFSYSLLLPSARIAAAAGYVTNSFGDSPTTRVSYTSLIGGGLRTHLGAQLLFQVPGYLAVQSSATPPLIVSQASAIREIYAVVAEAPLGSAVLASIRLNGQPLAEISIPPGQTRSPVVDGINLPPIPSDSVLTLDVLATGDSETQPGRDLTVIVRL